MTFQEFESKVKVSSSTLRFYEIEELLEKKINKKIDYEQSDIDNLLRIKLLRVMGFTTEEIKSFKDKILNLQKELEHRLYIRNTEYVSAEVLRDIRTMLLEDKVSYNDMNAEKYLDVLKQKLDKPVFFPEEDIVPKVMSPWKRYFARSLDYSIYLTIWYIFIGTVFNVNILYMGSGGKFLEIVAVFLLALICEPVFLKFFATTPGKWVFGIYVYDEDGDNLTISDARYRFLSVFWNGYGALIPIYSLVRLVTNYKSCTNGYGLVWETESLMQLKDNRGWRIGAFFMANAVLIAIVFISVTLNQSPKHHGDITVSEFSDNYNNLCSYYNDDSYGMELNSQGKWVKIHEGSYYFSFYGEQPEFEYLEENDKMIGMEFTSELVDSEVWPSSYVTLMKYSILSFVGAQEEYSPFSQELNDIIDQIADAPFESFQYSVYGVDIFCEVSYSGYISTLGNLYPDEKRESNYSFHFTIKKQDAL